MTASALMPAVRETWCHTRQASDCRPLKCVPAVPEAAVERRCQVAQDDVLAAVWPLPAGLRHQTRAETACSSMQCVNRRKAFGGTYLALGCSKTKVSGLIT